MPFTEINARVIPNTLKGKLLLGTVINNNDPLHLDRIQVEIPELFNPDMGELPWCMPAKNPVFGQGATWGLYGVPAVGSTVIIELQDGDSNFPVYRSFAQIQPNVNAEFDTPNKWGFIDPSGNKLFVDMETQTFQFTHSSGSVLTFSEGKQVTISCADITANVENTASVNCTTSNVNCTTSNVSSETSNIDTQQFNVTAQQSTFDCPTNNFAGIVNCQSIATGYGGGAGTATLQNVIVSDSLEAGGIEMITHTHTGVHGETSGPH